MENKATESIKSKKPNPWLDHVKKVREKTPESSYKEVLQIAKETYKPVDKPKPKLRKSKEDQKIDE